MSKRKWPQRFTIDKVTVDFRQLLFLVLKNLHGPHMAENEKISRNHFSPAVHKGPQIVFFLRKGQLSRDTVSLRDLTNFLKKKNKEITVNFLLMHVQIQYC